MEIALQSARLARTRALRVETVRGPEARWALDDEWDALVADQPFPNPTLLGGWQRELANLDGREPLLLRVFDGRRLVAGGMFACSRQHGLMRAAWAGGSWHDFSPDVIAAPGRSDAAEELVGALLEHTDVVSVVTVADGVFAGAVERITPHAVGEPRPGTYVVELPPRTLPKLTALAQRDERRARRAGVAVRARVASEPEDVARALERLFRIHRDRWRERDPEVGHFSTDAPTRAANRRAVSALAADGHVRIAEVFEDDVLVSSTMALVAGNAAVGNVKAMRAGHELKSPGHRGVLAIVERLIEEGIRLFDVGGSSTPLVPGSPKDRLSPSVRPFVALHVSNRPLLRRIFPIALAAHRRLRTAL